MTLRYRNALMHRQRIRESVATYFSMGGRLTLLVFAIVGLVFFWRGCGDELWISGNSRSKMINSNMKN